ncbi:MAG: hypothetical protein OXI34_05835 [Chloroflexota bacterium]|nr:hypothetical protein [Chloroflexota bacterium]
MSNSTLNTELNDGGIKQPLEDPECLVTFKLIDGNRIDRPACCIGLRPVRRPSGRRRRAADAGGHFHVGA